jgi:periplasmic divalent cation tolerance protein
MVRMMEEYIQVLTTVDDEKKASEIANAILDERVAACVQILGPISSSYWWKGKIEHAKEWICLAKARAEDYEKLQAVIKSVHPYEVPEILAVPVSFGNPAYLNWVRDETTRKG